MVPLTLLFPHSLYLITTCYDLTTELISRLGNNYGTHGSTPWFFLDEILLPGEISFWMLSGWGCLGFLLWITLDTPKSQTFDWVGSNLSDSFVKRETCTDGIVWYFDYVSKFHDSVINLMEDLVFSCEKSPSSILVLLDVIQWFLQVIQHFLTVFIFLYVFTFGINSFFTGFSKFRRQYV